MQPSSSEHHPVSMNNKWFLIILMAAVLGTAVAIGAVAGYHTAEDRLEGVVTALVFIPLLPLLAYVLYRRIIFPYYRQLEDANLELHIKQEELLDTKDDLFIKFLGIYDVNYAANSPRLFTERLNDVADITARVMEADRCLIFLYERKSDDLNLVAANEGMENALGKATIPLGEGIEGWVGRRLEPVILKDFRRDARFRKFPGLDLTGLQAVYCLPLYVYSNGALMGVIEVFYGKPKTFRDEEINFFTTLSGILSTTIQNEQMQGELRRMNMELEQWVAEKTEELRASEERYRTLVENSIESIVVLAQNGDIVFANEQAALLTGLGKYELIRRNLFDIFIPAERERNVLSAVVPGARFRLQGELRKADGTLIPGEVLAVGLTLIGKRFIQCVIHDRSSEIMLQKLIEEKDREIAALKSRLRS